MEWFINFIKRLLRINEVKLIEEPKTNDNFKNSKEDFIFNLKRSADLERNDGNGYKIIPYTRLKDMV